MKKTISILVILITVLVLAACGKTEEVTIIPTDMERIVELSLDSQSDDSLAEEAPQAPAVEYTQEHYTFLTTAADGLLTVDVDADVRYPETLQLPVARVSAVGFTQEQASAYFDYFFAGEQPIVVENNGAAKVTKQSLRDLIALYEQQIDDGTILQQQQLTEEEAREEIKRLEAQIPDAPDTVPPDVISDGTMLPGVWMNNDEPEELLELNVKTDDKWLDIYTPVNADEHAEGHLFYDRRDTDGFYEATMTTLEPNTTIEGMSTTWDEAEALCEDFLSVCGVNDMAVGEAFQLDENGRSAYRFNFVRTVAGVTLAVNHETTTYKGAKTPWGYEILTITVDDGGICDIGWSSPAETTEIVNPAANAIAFSQAAEIFETMVAENYTQKTERYDGMKWNVTVSVDEIVLSLLRIRDVSTDERTGLYVPAWVFYGKTTTNGYPDKNWGPQIVFAINALDGTVIDMEQGY